MADNGGASDAAWMVRLEDRLDSIDERLRGIEIKMAIVETKALLLGGIAGFAMSVLVGVIVKIL